MTRTYRRKKYPGRGRGRMLLAAQLRAEGKSLRAIARQLRVSHETVRRDLAKWDTERPQVSHLPVTKVPPGAGFVTPKCDSQDAEILPLRRSS